MRIRLGGVPEHFNYLWLSSEAREVFRNYGHYLEWTDFPGGTGAMAASLEEGDIDLAIMLTEGAISQISAGKKFKIMFPFVMSPLLWGVFVSAKFDKPKLDSKSRFAISRFHSGSHLMAMFLAKRQNIDLTESNFVLSHNLEGARKALAQKDADFFLWEQYMTQPLVYTGEFRLVDTISAPWPAFCFVCREDGDFNAAEPLWPIVKQCIASFYSLPNAEIVSELAAAYHISRDDAASWLEEVRYYDGNEYWKDRMVAASIIMQNAGMIQDLPSLEKLLFQSKPACFQFHLNRLR